MILIKPSFEILFVNAEALQLIELAGRTCYKSEARITSETAPVFAASIIKRGHESVIEHATASVLFVVDRGVSHEIVRHRLASYSQESTRYCDYDHGNVTFVIPPWTGLPEGAPTAPHWRGVNNINGACRAWLESMLAAEESYKYLRMMGWKPEQARSVLPNSLKTEIVMTANLREWRHFFRLRTAAAAHPQMREVALPLLSTMKQRVPVIFDDLPAGGAQ